MNTSKMCEQTNKSKLYAHCPSKYKPVRAQSDLGMHIILKFLSFRSTFKAQRLIQNTNNKN